MIGDQRELGCVAFVENIDYSGGRVSVVPWKTITFTVLWNVAWVCALAWLLMKVLDLA